MDFKRNGIRKFEFFLGLAIQTKFIVKIQYTESLGEFPIKGKSICIVYGNFSTKFILSKNHFIVLDL